MPRVIYAEPSDEIVDLVDRVRGASDEDVALVLGPGTTGFQTALNVRLLHQVGTRAGKRVSVISGDPHIQELSRTGGLPTYASVPAFERGIQTIRPHQDDGIPGAAAAAAGLMYPPSAPPAPPPPPPRTAAGRAVAGPTPKGGGGRRRPLYFVAIGVAVVGILLFVVVAPSAKVTITVAGTPLTVSPTIQGSPAAAAGQADHIVTSVVTSQRSAQFTATPSGQKQVAATSAKTQVVLHSKLLTGATVLVSQGAEFDTASNPPIKFNATQAASVTFPPSDGTTYVDGSPPIPVQASSPGAAENSAADTIVIINPDPCAPGNSHGCGTGDITVSNPQAATGGADAKTLVVASQSDVTSWSGQVAQSKLTLTAQVNQDMLAKAAGNIIARDPGGNGSSVACTVNPALPAPNTAFAAAQIVVGCSGRAAVYNPADITGAVTADLQAQVAQGDSLATNAIACTKPSVTQAADDGTVVLSIQCTSFSRPAVDLEALKGQLTGRSPGNVRTIIENRLNHVQNVAVAQSPIPFFWLPFFSSRIEIDETFVTQTGR